MICMSFLGAPCCCHGRGVAVYPKPLTPVLVLVQNSGCLLLGGAAGEGV
jgi:hypothetical protein